MSTVYGIRREGSNKTKPTVGDITLNVNVTDFGRIATVNGPR